MTTVAGAGALAGCAHVHTCNTATYSSADVAWGIAFCQNFFVTLNDPHFGSEMDSLKGCMAASTTDSSTYQKCYNLVVEGSINGAATTTSSTSSYYDLYIVFLIVSIVLFLLAVVPWCAYFMLSPKAQAGDGEAV